MGLEPLHALLKQFVLGDVGGIAYQDIQADVFFFEGFKQVAAEEFDVGAQFFRSKLIISGIRVGASSKKAS